MEVMHMVKCPCCGKDVVRRLDKIQYRSEPTEEFWPKMFAKHGKLLERPYIYLPNKIAELKSDIKEYVLPYYAYLVASSLNDYEELEKINSDMEYYREMCENGNGMFFAGFFKALSLICRAFMEESDADKISKHFASVTTRYSVFKFGDEEEEEESEEEDEEYEDEEEYYDEYDEEWERQCEEIIKNAERLKRQWERNELYDKGDTK